MTKRVAAFIFKGKNYFKIMIALYSMIYCDDIGNVKNKTYNNIIMPCKHEKTIIII